MWTQAEITDEEHGCGSAYVALAAKFLDENFELDVRAENQEEVCKLFEDVAMLLILAVESGLLTPRGSMVLQ